MRYKLEGIINMNNFRILDLFSGAGGFSLGFDMVPGFSTEVALDFDSKAIETFQRNFPNTTCICGDITQDIQNLWKIGVK